MTAADLDAHDRLGIARDVLAGALVRRVSDAEARDAPIGLTGRGNYAGIVYPYIDPATGYAVGHRVRRDHPEMTADGRPDRKYLTPYGDHRHLYLSAVGSAGLSHVRAPVVIVESEKAALMLASVAARTGCALAPVAMGGCWGWRGRIGRTEDATGARVDVRGPLTDFDRFNWSGRTAIVWLDADAQTNSTVSDAQRSITRELASRGAVVRVARAPDARGKEGPDDYRARTDDAAVLLVLDSGDVADTQFATVADHLAFAQLDALPDNVSPDDLESRLSRLAESVRHLPPLRRQLVRVAAVAALKAAKVSSPAKLIDAALRVAEPATTDASGRSPVVEDDAPWPDPVNTADLLDALTDCVRRHVVLTSEAHAHAIALWTLHAWCADHTPVLPLLTLSSPTKRCGKSTALGVIGNLTPRALTTSNISPAALFRSVEKWRPTLLIDEADTTLPNNDALRGLLNAGHTRGATLVIRCVGDDLEPTTFSVWGPKVLAMIGRPADTVLDRSVLVELRRKTTADRIEARRVHTEGATLAPLRQQCRRWADDHGAMLASADPTMPAGLNDRAADNWRGMVAIADHAGPEWTGKAFTAALALSGLAETGDESIGVQLLTDLRDVWPADTDWWPTTELLAALQNLDERPWRTFGRDGKGLNAHRLGKMLREFKIQSRDARTRESGKVAKGYLRAPIEDAALRYTSVEAQQRDTPTESRQSRAMGSATAGDPRCASDDENCLERVGRSRCCASSHPTQEVSADDTLTI